LIVLRSRYRNLAWMIVLLTLSVPLAAQQSAPERSQEPANAQAIEAIDLSMYQRIADEEFNHSAIMGYASALADDIGPRLTGSPNMAKANKWTQEQLTEMGCANAHLESWGEAGMGWQQLNTWVRMASPDTAVFIAQATPWSPSTPGPVTGDAVLVDVSRDGDLSRYKGKLAGKVVLFGPMRPVPPVDEPLLKRLADGQSHAIPHVQNRAAEMKRGNWLDSVAQFFAEEHVAGVIEPSRDAQEGGGGSGGTLFDDNGATLSLLPYSAEHRVNVPVVVMAIENYGRMYRLLKAGVPVTVQMDVETKFTGDHEPGFNTIAEIPGTDPRLKEQLVMLGAHLDSWTAGTGATDNGAGVAISMETMRILTALHVHPRRTIRVALWSGEEMGHRGSRGYVTSHFGSYPLSTAPDQMKIPEYHREAVGPLALKPDQKLVSVYFNLDNGGGRIRGVYLQGNGAIEPVFQQWMTPLASMGVTTLTLDDESGTDHMSFDAVGIPGFEFVQDPLDYHTRTHHSNMDLYESLRPDDMKQAAVVEAIFVYNAAMRDQMLPRKPLTNADVHIPAVRQPDKAQPK
jgi:carboxypeptidase Q